MPERRVKDKATSFEIWWIMNELDRELPEKEPMRSITKKIAYKAWIGGYARAYYRMEKVIKDHKVRTDKESLQ